MASVSWQFRVATWLHYDDPLKPPTASDTTYWIKQGTSEYDQPPY